MAFLAGNATNSLGGLGIYGPFDRSTGSRTLSPGQSVTFTLRITGAVPSALVNKVAAAGIAIYSGTGDNVYGGSGCFVPVIP